MLLSGTLSTLDKEKIAYYHYKNGYETVIVIAHGFYNSKDSSLLQKLAKSLIDTYDVFMFDFRGHGKSSGLFTWTSNEGKDLEVVLNYLKNKYKKIGLIAFSLGSSISINVLSKIDLVSSFVCVSPVSDLYKVDYQFWKLDFEDDLVYTLLTPEGKKGKGVRIGPFWLAKEKPIYNVEKIKVPVLYIHGQKDWVVKPWHSKVLYENTKTEKKIVIIEDGPHAEYLLKKSFDKFIKIVKDWFSNTLNAR